MLLKFGKVSVANASHPACCLVKLCYVAEVTLYAYFCWHRPRCKHRLTSLL
uniref:Uncharacterized protein n=1 Tax=Anguilla anguilla TaxID=7936 RepID=A0A0E9QS96_ANGAN